MTIGVLSRLTTRAGPRGAGRSRPRTLPIYLTEFGIQSHARPALRRVAAQRQAEYRAISERIAYDNPRVKAFSQYLLRDDEPRQGRPALQRYSGFESGLRTAGGKAKPSLDGLPAAARRAQAPRPKVSLWGFVRPATGRHRTIQYRNGASARSAT